MGAFSVSSFWGLLTNPWALIQYAHNMMHLDADGHIDHMYPISQGGCNDLVNLQLLCSTCNLTKLVSTAEVVTSSVPQYTRRK
jgi:5-methylcytosine-specific restriction endonuclease McrA